MSNRDLEIALRVKADLDEARTKLQGLSGDIEAVGVDAQSSSAAMTKLNAAASNQTAVVRAATMTVGQYQQAMRQLPMQITDVVTSVASGMPIWMVAIQQGGQVRDSFGGIGAAARALVSTINPLTAAIAATVGSALALVAAYEAGAGEGRAFNEALILTGNHAGKTAGELAAMARQLDSLDGVTQASAADAVTEVVQNGKFAGEQIMLVATAAEQMRVATGKAISDTIADFAKMADDPVAAILKLNETQHFLTEAQLEQIRTLIDQQGQQAAATEAMRVYSSVIAERTPQVNQNLGTIEEAWRNIKQVARETIDGLMSIGRTPDDTQQIEQLTQRIAYLRSTLGSGFEPLADTQGEIDRLSKQLDSLNAKQKAAADSTKATVDSAAETARQAAASSFIKAAESQTQSLQKLTEVQRAHQLMQKEGIEETSVLGKRMLEAAGAADKQRAATDAAAEAERKAEAAKRKSKQEEEARVRASEQAARAQLSYVQGLEKQAATLGLSASAVRQYELAERGLTDAMAQRAAAAMTLIDLGERKRQADEDGRQLATIQAQLLASQGQYSAAAAMQLEQQYGELAQRLQQRGDQAGVDLINRLINVEQARAKLDELQGEIDRVLADQGRREQTINTQQQAGLLSEIGAREQILELNRMTASQIEQLLPRMRELANVTGDPAAIERLKDLETRLVTLKHEADQFSLALKAGFETGIQSALQGLATGTMNLREAALSFINSIANSMASMASQQLAKMAASGLAGMFGGEQSDTSMTTGAAAVTASAGALSVAGGTLLTGAGAIEAAAASLAAANGGGAVMNVGGSGGSGWMSLATSAASAYTGAYGFAGGGHVRGPGTATSDSINAKLSNNEYVVRAAVVTQQGMLPLLDAINARGLSALDDWYGQRLSYHATGGLAGIPAPSIPAPVLPSARLAEPARNLSATLKNNMTFNLIDDPKRIADAAYGSLAGQEAFTVMLSRDPARYRSILGIS